MQVLLRIANGKSNVRKVRLQSDTVIGRSPDCQLKVASSQISRRHCQIVINGTIVGIKDLGSANGTFVNGRRIPAEVVIPLTPGTRVMLGPLQFTIDYELPGLSSAAASLIEEDIDTQAESPLDTFDDVAPEQDVSNNDAAATVEAPPSDLPEAFPVPTFAPEFAPFAQEANPFLTTAPQAPASAAPAADLEQTAYMINPFTVMESFAEPAPPVAAPKAVAVPAAATPIPTAKVVPASVVPTAQPVFQSIPVPEVAAPNEGEFNFGIFAGSGSDVVVESAAEISFVQAPIIPDVAQPPKPKSEKKGFLQMLGFGTKKTAEPAPQPATEAPAIEPPPVAEIIAAPVVDLPIPQAVPIAAPLDGMPSFEIPVAEGPVPADAPDDSLQSFFNNIQNR
jgi:hypothetical protein